MFRDRLQDAVRHSDHRFLLTAVHPRIKVGFGGDIGTAGFKRAWNPENPRSEIWGILDRLLGLGAGFHSPGTFIIPYQAWRFPEGCARFDTVAVVVKNAKIRAAPNMNASVIAVVSYDILERPPVDTTRSVAVDDAGRHPANDPPGWIQVFAPSGRLGYIDDRSVYSSFGYRAWFTKATDRWLMDFFGSGD